MSHCVLTWRERVAARAARSAAAASTAGPNAADSVVSSSNLRALTVNILKWRTGHDPAARHHAALVGSIIAAFAVGAGVGALCTRLIHHQAAWIPAAALMIVLIAIVTETRRLDRRGDTTPPTTVQSAGSPPIT